MTQHFSVESVHFTSSDDRHLNWCESVVNIVSDASTVKLVDGFFTWKLRNHFAPSPNGLVCAPSPRWSPKRFKRWKSTKEKRTEQKNTVNEIRCRKFVRSFSALMTLVSSFFRRPAIETVDKWRQNEWTEFRASISIKSYVASFQRQN